MIINNNGGKNQGFRHKYSQQRGDEMPITKKPAGLYFSPLASELSFPVKESAPMLYENPELSAMEPVQDEMFQIEPIERSERSNVVVINGEPDRPHLTLTAWSDAGWRSSYTGHEVDALAPRADEGRGRLR